MRYLLWLVFCLSVSASLSAAPRASLSTLQQVFVSRNVDALGNDRLTFVDMLTGEQTAVTVNGSQYTVVGPGVLYYDSGAARVKVALPDGEVLDHPFIQPAANTRRIDWLVSDDGRRLAWTLTDGIPEALTTITTVANIDGTNARQVLADGPRDGIRAMPVAFSPDANTLYMDYQPDSIGDLTPFRQYAGLFRLDLTTGDVAMLPGEPGCFCGADVSGDYFLRLGLTDDLRGFNVHVRNLARDTENQIDALNLVGFTQAGDVLISPDGGKALYALAQINGFGRAEQTMRTVFVLVDLTRHTQVALTEPLTTFVRPVAWTDDNSGVLFASPTLDGTWKVTLEDGALKRIAAATYIGTIGA